MGVGGLGEGLGEEGGDFEEDVVETEVVILEMEAEEEVPEMVVEMVGVVVTVVLVVVLVEMEVVEGWEVLEADEDAGVGLGVGLRPEEVLGGQAELVVGIAGVEEELVGEADLEEVCNRAKQVIKKASMHYGKNNC